MPKLSNSLLVDRLRKRIADLENGVALEARDINVLLNEEQKRALVEAWDWQRELRKKHKPTISDEEKQEVGWKTIREVRLEILHLALEEASESELDGLRKELKKREVRKAKVELEAIFRAKKEGKDPLSAARIAAARAGFRVIVERNNRDEEVRAMEEKILANSEGQVD